MRPPIDQYIGINKENIPQKEVILRPAQVGEKVGYTSCKIITHIFFLSPLDIQNILIYFIGLRRR
jgi:hypothetical protein